MTTPALPPLRLATAPDPAPGRARALPAALVGTASRGNGAGALDPILGNVAVAESWDIGPRARGDAGREVNVEPDARLLAPEAADGTTVFIRADAWPNASTASPPPGPSCATTTAASIWLPCAPATPRPGAWATGCGAGSPPWS